jgi:hypothetical protein
MGKKSKQRAEEKKRLASVATSAPQGLAALGSLLKKPVEAIKKTGGLNPTVISARAPQTSAVIVRKAEPAKVTKPLAPQKVVPPVEPKKAVMPMTYQSQMSRLASAPKNVFVPRAEVSTYKSVMNRVVAGGSDMAGKRKKSVWSTSLVKYVGAIAASAALMVGGALGYEYLKSSTPQTVDVSCYAPKVADAAPRVVKAAPVISKAAPVIAKVVPAPVKQTVKRATLRPDYKAKTIVRKQVGRQPVVRKALVSNHNSGSKYQPTKRVTYQKAQARPASRTYTKGRVTHEAYRPKVVRASDRVTRRGGHR